MDSRSYNRSTVAALVVLFLWRLPINSSTQLDSICPQAIFSFGDSLTDTGNAIFNKPFTTSTQRALQDPYGSTYFGRPSNRFSDGRLLVDFLAQAFGYPFLAPYLDSIGPDYRRGANFAYCGAEGRDDVSNPAVNNLPVQIKQFEYFKMNVLAKLAQSEGVQQKLLLPSPEVFPTALYYIFIGINDFLHGYTLHESMTASQLNATVVPNLITSVSNAIQSLYELGARNFVIVNVPPLGCMPDMLGIALRRNRTVYKDSVGCWGSVNSVIQHYNHLLLQQIQYIMKNITSFAGTIDVLDSYRVYYDLVQNAEINSQDPVPMQTILIIFRTPCFLSFILLYKVNMGNTWYYYLISDLGFNSSTILQSCFSTKNACSNSSTYISWDGIHFTDAFNKHMARTFLTGRADICSLDLGRL